MEKVQQTKFLIRLVLIFMITNTLYAQSIYDRIESIYHSKSTNKDSLKKAILSIPNNSIDIYKFQKIVERKLEEDTSFLCKLKSFYFVKQIYRGIKKCETININTHDFYYWVIEYFYANTTSDDYQKNYMEDYNSIFKDELDDCFGRKSYFTNERTIAFYKEYVSKRPTLLRDSRLIYFWKNNIPQYNDLILEYILKSPDSMDWDNKREMLSLHKEALYTLFYFGDRRVLPYYIYGVKNEEWRYTGFLREVLYTYEMQKTNDILYIQLMVLKSLYEKEGSLSLQSCDFIGLSNELISYPVKPLLYYLGLLLPEELPYEKQSILEQKPPEEIKRVALDIIDKKLKELEQEKK